MRWRAKPLIGLGVELCCFVSSVWKNVGMTMTCPVAFCFVLWHVVFCPSKQRSFEPSTRSDLLLHASSHSRSRFFTGKKLINIYSSLLTHLLTPTPPAHTYKHIHTHALKKHHNNKKIILYWCSQNTVWLDRKTTKHNQNQISGLSFLFVFHHLTIV